MVSDRRCLIVTDIVSLCLLCADIVSVVGVDSSTSRRSLSQLRPGADATVDEIAAFIYNLLATGQTSSAASAIAQASSQGATGADAISTALATAASTVVSLLSH